MIKIYNNTFCFRNSTHETQTDSPFVFGYWFDWFKPKIEPTLGNLINNYLILKFLQNYTGNIKVNSLYLEFDLTLHFGF